MIKSGYTYRATWGVALDIVYVARRQGGFLEVHPLTGDLQGRSLTITDKDRPGWVEVCRGRHSNPEALLTQTGPEPLAQQGDVRKGKTTGALYEVLGVHGNQVWTHSTGGTDPAHNGYQSWSVGNFLKSTVEMPTFFEEGHDYEMRTVAGGVIRVTVRAVGKMPNGAPYAVAEHRNGTDTGEPVLLASYDFPSYEDVTR